MKTFTEDQKRENLKVAVAALRANEKKGTYMMCDEAGGRCCLCVMADVAEKITGRRFYESGYDEAPFKELEDVFPIESIAHSYFDFNLTIKGSTSKASSHNDGDDTKERTHKEIAEAIEKQYLS